MLCPIQRVDADDASPPVYTRSREKAAGMVLFSCDVTAGTPSLTVVLRNMGFCDVIQRL